jgi:hypothetical protein
MQPEQKIFLIYTSSDAANSFLNYEDNTYIDWLSISQFLGGAKPCSGYMPIELTVKHKKALECDFYSCSGSYGLFSARAVTTLGETALQNYQLFPVKLNGESYFLHSKL